MATSALCVHGQPPIGEALASPEVGRPYFAQRFSPRDYDAHRQNWAVLQSPDGTIWVGNTEGLLWFDGAQWRRLSIPGESVRSLAIDATGRLYVGGVGTIGYVTSTPNGEVAYVELLGRNALAGEDVWTANAVGAGVVLQTSLGVYRADGTHITLLGHATAESRFHKAFATRREGRDRFFVRQEGIGLLELGPSGEHLTLVNGGESYAAVRIRALFEHPQGGLLIATSDAVEILRNGQRRQLVASELPEVLDRHGIYHGIALSDHAFALATLGAGVVIIDQNGQVLQHLGSDVGLTTQDLVLDLGQDQQGGLWLAMGSGLARFDALAPVSFFDTALGLPGTVYALHRMDGVLYAASESGLFHLVASAEPGEPAHFEFAGITGQVWDLVDAGGAVLAATNAGVYEIHPNGQHRLVWEGAALDLLVPSDYPHEVLVGTDSGLRILRRRGGVWGLEPSGASVASAVRVVTQADDGYVWASTADSVFVLARSMSGSYQFVRSYPVSGALLGNLLGPIIITNTSVMRPNDRNALVWDNALTRILRSTDTTRSVAWRTDANERLWLSRGGHLRAFAQRDGQWLDVTPTPLRTLRDGLRAVYSEGSTLWIGTESGLLRYEQESLQSDRYAVAPKVRLSTWLGSTSLWAGGAPGVERLKRFTVSSASGPVRFEFVAAAFNDIVGNRYRTQLHGIDIGWSRWTGSTWREYTNLPPGEYTFAVQAVTAQGIGNGTATAVITIKPRWFETWWVRLAAIVLLVGGIGALAQQRVRVHRKRAQAEAQRADDLAGMNMKLQEADRLKDQMLANASHELRTPLTAILGYADLLSEYDGGGPPEEVRETAAFILSGARRLDGTVQDLMDAAALRAGRAELASEPVNVRTAVHQTVATKSAAANTKGLAIIVVDTDSDVYVRADRRALNRVLEHLVDNAIKFTDRGDITIAIRPTTYSVSITVKDCGRGIDHRFIPHIFDEFKQESTGFARGYEGNGLGLFIVGGLIRLMKGTVDLRSEAGVGTEVELRLDRIGSRNQPSGDGTVGDILLASTDPVV